MRENLFYIVEKNILYRRKKNYGKYQYNKQFNNKTQNFGLSAKIKRKKRKKKWKYK